MKLVTIISFRYLYLLKFHITKKLYIFIEGRLRKLTNFKIHDFTIKISSTRSNSHNIELWINKHCTLITEVVLIKLFHREITILNCLIIHFCELKFIRTKKQLLFYNQLIYLLYYTT